MKHSGDILGSLLRTSQFTPLRQHRCYRKFLELLPPRFRRAIAFVTIKNGRLMVALSHPGYKMELNYNQELLKDLLRTLREHQPECAFMEAQSVVLFHSKYHAPVDEERQSVPHYRELASGEFGPLPQDDELRESFERIRRWVRKNGATEEERWRS